MAIVVESITHVWFAGRMIAPGITFAVDDAYGKKLIEGKSAKVANAIENGDNELEDLMNLTQKLDALTVTKLEELAEKHSISLEFAKKKSAIIEKIIASGVVLDEKDI